MKTYGTLSRGGNGNWVLDDLEPQVCLRLKRWFPSIPRAKTNPFLIAATPDNSADLAVFTRRYPMNVCPWDMQSLLEMEGEFFKHQEEMALVLLDDYEPPASVGFKPGQGLRDYQAQAVQLLRLNKALLVGDKVGLGKTWVGIGAAVTLGALPALVSVQVQNGQLMAAQWQAMFQQACDLRVHIIMKNQPYALPPADVFIAPYNRIPTWIDFLVEEIKPRLLVWDEVQELRRGTHASGSGPIQKGVAAETMARRAEYVLGLSATPIYNYGSEIFNILNLMKPGCLGSKNEFDTEWTGYENRVREPRVLGAYLREKGLVLRRTRADVGRELPSVNTLSYEVPYNDSEVKKAENLAVSLALRTLNGSFTERGQASRELDALVRKMTGVAKARAVAEYVRMILESGESVLLAGWHHEVYEIWGKALDHYNPVFFHGKTSPAQKAQNKEAFAQGKTKLFIGSLRSLTGIDGIQNNCSIVIFGELDWSPQIHHQVIGRLNRDGQKEPVMAIYLHTAYGSDPSIIETLGIKESQSRGIVDPFLGLETVHRDGSRIQAMARDFLASRGVKAPRAREAV